MKNTPTICSTEDFQLFVKTAEDKGFKAPAVFAIGYATKDNQGNILEVFYSHINYPVSKEHGNFGAAAVFTDYFEHKSGTNMSYPIDRMAYLHLLSYFNPFIDDGRKHQNIEDLCDFVSASFDSKDRNVPVVTIIDDLNSAPVVVSDVYLRLHMLSHRLVRPHEISLENAFSILPNVAWTNQGAISLAELPDRQMKARLEGSVLDVISVDKFPKMTNYVVPPGVRIADAARVRLGAYLGEGTTVMHEGFVNFNAGTLGKSMVEGRISAGVVVGAGSDLGGGCSTMGTLSGGNDVVISVGEECLIGANAGLGIPLGDRCILEAGLYLTAGTKVTMTGWTDSDDKMLKAAELSGKSDLLFRRNSITGRVECLPNGKKVSLNEVLHANN